MIRILLTVISGILLGAGALTAAPRPNIVIIMADDMGYSDIGPYGGEINTPNLDRLAANGLRFTQFYNSGRCCPTRAALLTGLHPHQAGIGHMTSEGDLRFDLGYPGYRGRLNRECVTIAEVLKLAGYRTLMAGKWHVGTYAGMWPRDRGFDRFYGLVRGAGNHFRPRPDKLLSLDDTPVIPAEDDFYSTDAFTTYAISFLREAERIDDDQPFFLYLAYTSPHWPMQAWPQDVAKYRGKYRKGWDQLRLERLARMRKMGLLKSSWRLSEHDRLPWDILPESTKDEMAHRMAIYAAMVDRMDQNIGRVITTLEQLSELDNTLILFLADNGGCAEGGNLGGGPREYLGTKKGYFLTYGRGWANASNTPFRKYKHWVHEGGIASPLIVHWPQGVRAKGEFRAEPTHVIDLMATAVDVAGADYPSEFNGHQIKPFEGESLLPVFAGQPTGREALYWEHEGNRAVRMGRWKLVAENAKAWELYDMEKDRSETNDLAQAKPEIRDKMIAMYEAWAKRCDVLPGRPRRKPGYIPEPLPYPKTADYRGWVD